MIRSRLYIISLALLFTILSPIFYSCKGKNLEKSTYGDSLYIAEYQRPSIIDPLAGISTISVLLSEMIFDGLIRFDNDLVPRPNLASSWEIFDNGTRWIFYLRKGVFFHDGVEMTAEDVKFTLDKLKDPRIRVRFSNAFLDLHSVIVKDRYTIEILFARPNYSLISAFDIGILPRHLLEKEDILNSAFNRHPTGTGPFRFVMWSDKEILLEANKNYFLGRPYLDRVLVRFYKDQEAAWAGLMRGDVDSFYIITPENFQTLKKIPDIRTYSYLKALYYMLVLNLREEIFKDKRVRQALNYAIDKERIVKEVLRGEGIVSKGTIYPGSWAYNKDINPYPYDPNKALELLKDAGWADHDGDHILDKDGKGFEFTLHINEGDNIKERAALIIQGQLLDIGVRMRVILFPAASQDFLFQGRFDAHFPEMIAWPDPDLSYIFWHSSQIKGGMNVSLYRNQEIDMLLDQGRGIEDIKERKAIYYRFQEEILNDPPGIFLFWSNYTVGLHKRFRDVKITASGPFNNIREWYVPKEEQRYK